MAKISSLTEAQKAKFPEYVDKWTNIGLSTEPMNFEKACAAMKEAYAVAGLTPPKYFFPAASPVDAIRVKNNQDLSKQKAQAADFIFGQHEANWLAFYSFILNELKIEECKKLLPLMEVAQWAGWILPYKNACVISDRPCEVHRDAEGRLHRVGGAAILYRDGWGVHAFHGTRIPKEWGEKTEEQWDPRWLLKTKNAEHRRILLRVIGYSRVMAALGSKVIHKSGDMELHKITQNVDVEPIVLLKVVCPSTRAFYALRVDPSMTDCETARRSTFNMKDRESFDIET